MRFLFTAIPGLGHFHPLVPLARALTDAGHAVAFATAPAFAEAVRDAGFECIPAGLDWDERRLLETLPELRPLARSYRGEWMMNTIFLDRSPRRMVPDLLRIITEWRPDAIVAGSFEYGGPLAAEKRGLPWATASYTVRWNRWILRHALGRPIARLRKLFGLPPDPKMKAFERHLDLCFAPPAWTFEGALLRPGLTRLVAKRVRSFDLPVRQRMWGVKALLLQRIFARSLKAHPEDAAVGPNTHFIGEGGGSPIRNARPAILQGMPEQPTVFVSLGTVLGGEHPEMFDKILEAFRDQPVNLVMTLGGSGDPDRFGAQPPSVRIVCFLTQDELRDLLPHVDLCINHAGYGSIMEALLRGKPLVVLPLVSDAPMNNQMCLSSGVAPELDPAVWGISPKGLPVIQLDRLTPTIIRDAAMQALRQPGYRAAARRIERELAERPSLQTAVDLLEAIARRPKEASESE
jgi:UDP:flavonoid glycosyltransferase YjiC (YdhE family)